MNRWVRIFFLPIMLLAGVVVGFCCALIVAPFALCHRLRQLRSTRSDITRYREHCRLQAERIYGAPPTTPAAATSQPTEA